MDSQTRVAVATLVLLITLSNACFAFETLPNLTLTDSQGNKISLDTYLQPEAQSRTLLIYWYVGCEPCDALLDDVISHQSEIEQFGYCLKSICLTDVDGTDPAKYSKPDDLPFPTAFLPWQHKSALVLGGVPTITIVENGEEIWRLFGYREGRWKDLHSAISAVSRGEEPSGGYSDWTKLKEALAQRDQFAAGVPVVEEHFNTICQHGGIYEIDDTLAGLGFAITEEGIKKTKHGLQPYHVWSGNYRHNDHDYYVIVDLAYGRADWYFYNVVVGY